MAINKVHPTTESVSAFLDRQDDQQRWVDCQTLVAMMQSATQSEPVMWGREIVGFGRQNYFYWNGRSEERYVMGFTPNTRGLTIYITSGIERYEELLKTLGPYKRGVGCIYLNHLEEIDINVLQELFSQIAANAPQFEPAPSGDGADAPSPLL